jgi:glycosyltransferase involved in cell wall biosynthesis
MRILQIGKYYPPAKGGMETVLGLITEGLLARGHDVCSVVAATEHDDANEALGVRPGTGRLIRCGTLATIASQPVTPSLPAVLRRIFQEFAPEIVTLHWPNPLAAFALQCVRSGLPAASRLTVWYHADITRQRLGALVLSPLLHSLLDRADGIAVSTGSLRDRSPKLTRRSAKVRVIPFGIDTGAWRLDTAAGAGPFLFVGRLVYYKGLDLLLEAVASVPGIQLEIVGDGPLRDRLRRRAAAPDLQGRVHMHGELDDAALRRVMTRCAALVLPSLERSETFGLVQIEAMAAGLPVISTQLPTGVAEVNVHGETGLIVPPGDRAALAEALRDVVADPGRSRAWGEAGRRRVDDHFNHERMIDALERWYRELADTGEAGP